MAVASLLHEVIILLTVHKRRGHAGQWFVLKTPLQISVFFEMAPQQPLPAVIPPIIRNFLEANINMKEAEDFEENILEQQTHDHSARMTHCAWYF
jgi:hypothetical protein